MDDEASSPDGLTARQDAAIIALISTNSIMAAAKKAKVPTSTLYAWMKLPAFNREYRRARRFVTEQAFSQLGQIAKDAVLTLKRNLKCKVPAVEVRAATAVLDKAISGQTIMDMQAEIEELRASLEKQNADARGNPVGTASAHEATASPPKPPGEPHDARSAPGHVEDGFEPRPVADGVPGGSGDPPDAALLPPSGKDHSSGSEDTDALFE